MCRAEKKTSGKSGKLRSREAIISWLGPPEFSSFSQHQGRQTLKKSCYLQAVTRNGEVFAAHQKAAHDQMRLDDF